MLTPQREAFAVAYVKQPPRKKGAGSAAYREAFNAENMSANAIAREASLLLKDPKVAQRIAELREPAAEEAGMTLKSHLADLKRLRDLAEKDGKFSAAVTAEVNRGKASGLYVEQVQLSGNAKNPVAVTVSAEDLAQAAKSVADRL